MNDLNLDLLGNKFGFKIMAALADDDISEIIVNPDGRLILKSEHRKYAFGMANISEISEAIRLLRENLKILLDEDKPDCSFNLPVSEPYRGARVKVIVPPVSSAFSLTIQKAKREIFSLKSYLDWGILSLKGYECLLNGLHSYQNIVISGEHRTGKTALLNALLNEVSQKDRVLIVEEKAELRASIDDLVCQKCTKSRTMTQLIENCLDMSPDRLVAGEITADNIALLLKAWPLRHLGSGGLTTFYSESIPELLKAFQTGIQVSNPSMRHSEVIEMILDSLDLLVHMTWREGDPRPQISEIVHLVGYDALNDQILYASCSS